MPSRRHLLGGAAALSPGLFPRRSYAQEMLRQVTVVVAFPAGGATDLAARMVAEALRGRYAAQAVVENRTGAGGRTGTEYTKRLPADGSALIYTPAFPLVISPHVYPNLGYDTLRDFAPVALTTRSMLALSVGPKVPAAVRTLPDFVAWCRANPDAATYGAPSGASQHFAGVLINRATGANMTLVPYRGGAPSIADLLGGHIAAVVSPLAEALPQHRSGELRILVTLGTRRSRFLADVPSAGEHGFPDIVFQDWSGVFAPAGTPPALIQRANAIINDLMRSERGVEALARFGAEPDPQDPDAFATAVRADWERYRDIVRSSGFVGED